MRTKVLLALIVAGGPTLGLAESAHGDGSDALVNVEVEDNHVVLLSGITVAVAANVCAVQVNTVQTAVVDPGQDVDCHSVSQRRGQRTVIRRQGSAASAPDVAHRQGDLVNIELHDNQVVLLNGITVAVAANMCGVDLNAIQASVVDSGQDVDCRAMSQQRQQRTVIHQARR